MKKLVVLSLIIIGCNKINENDMSNTSIDFWEIKYFVNQLKEATDVGYITNRNPIIGTFTTPNGKVSTLKAKIMIKDKAVGIKLYENEEETAVKGHKQYPLEYEITIQHNNKNIDTIFRGINENDVIVIGNIISSTQQTILINHLKMGGNFQFYLEVLNTNKIYRFTINDKSNQKFSNIFDTLNKEK